MSSIRSKIRDLEREARKAGGRPDRVRMAWVDDDGLVDQGDGERLTPEEVRARHPGRWLFVSWEQ